MIQDFVQLNLVNLDSRTYEIKIASYNSYPVAITLSSSISLRSGVNISKKNRYLHNVDNKITALLFEQGH